MSSDLLKNAIAFLQRRYPHATITNNERTVTAYPSGTKSPKFWPLIVQDGNSAVKVRAIALPLVSPQDDLTMIVSVFDQLFTELDTSIFIGLSHADPKGHAINSTQMPFAPRVLLYINCKDINYSSKLDKFSSRGILIDIVNEAEMYNSLFISYGGPDEDAAAAINGFLKSRGIKTWFFPDDALPGQKLHRMMHEGVNKHDRVLLICSESSLTRPGVLNELERVLEKEADEGGSDILVPVTLDDFVYTNWAPTRPDVAAQVRSRVVTKLSFDPDHKDHLHAQLEKVVKALAKTSL